MSIHGRIKAIAEQYPANTAVEQGSRHVSYAELTAFADRVADFFARELGASADVAPNRHVAIMLERSPELIGTMLGVLKSGGIFVPLDLRYPAERLRTMLDEAECRWVVLNSANLPRLREMLAGLGVIVQVLVVDGEQRENECAKNGYCVLEDTDRTNAYLIQVHYLHRTQHPTSQTSNQADTIPNPYCYIYFTSGSTGRPKGVLGRHRSLEHFIEWEISEFAVESDCRFGQLTSPSFDPFLRDIFVPLAAGATICLPEDEEVILNPRRLLLWLEEMRITFLHTTPSLFKGLAREVSIGDRLAAMRYILLAGEKLRGQDVKHFLEQVGTRIQLVNVYGPTETTLAKFFYRIRPEDSRKINIPVGKPLPLTEVLILNEHMEECPAGSIGEVYIRTPFISSGYYRRPELSRAVFVQNPFNTNPRDLLYKTGDLGRLTPDGNLELLGRVDQQVKIRGVRIEPAEIENRLLTHPVVQEAVVMVEETEGEPVLAAFLVLRGQVFVPELRAYLGRELPEYMVPTRYHQLEVLPLLPNGKVNRAELGIGATLLASGVEYTAPTNAIEQKLAQIWEALFGVERVGIYDNFLDLGGHSLKAMSLVTRIHDELGVELPIREVFANPDIYRQAKIVAVLKEHGYNVFFEPYQLLTEKREEAIFFFPPIVGYGIVYQEMAALIDSHAVYSFDFIEKEDPLKEYVELITRIQPTGPYLLAGYSAGGTLAFEVARALEMSGQEVRSIIMLDSARNDSAGEMTEEGVEEIVSDLLSRVTDPTMRDFLSIESMAEQVRGKIRSYLRYRMRHTETGQVRADIHFIEAEVPVEQQGMDMSHRDWSGCTSGRLVRYQGKGEHRLMLAGENLRENVRMLLGVMAEG